MKFDMKNKRAQRINIVSKQKLMNIKNVNKVLYIFYIFIFV